jgi:uncharacterized protein (TIGR02300 family)
MARTAERGSKRTCQNNSCGARFYDLNRDPIMCPMCASVFQVQQTVAAAIPAAEARPRPAKKPEFVAPVPGEAAEVEGEDVLADGEGTDEPVAAGGDEETFLEEEDEGGDVSGIIGGPAAEGDEEV